MRILIFIFLFSGLYLRAQDDKIFLKDGGRKTGIVVTIGNDFVLYKASDTSANTSRILKADILLIEKYDGKVFVFGKKIIAKDSVMPVKYHHGISIQPLGVILGRVTVNYEHLNKTGSLGIMVPLALTFNPYKETINSSGNNGINFIGGVDVNFYLGKGDYDGFFIGPRIRYGTDVLLNMEAYTIQTQAGWRLSEKDERLSQHIAIGFGVARILSSSAGNRINPKQSYGWCSISYRVGLNW